MSIYLDKDGDLWVDCPRGGVECISSDDPLTDDEARAALLAGSSDGGYPGVDKESATEQHLLVELIERKPIDINEVLGAAVMAYERTDSSHTPKLGAALTAAFIAAGFEIKK